MNLPRISLSYLVASRFVHRLINREASTEKKEKGESTQWAKSPKKQSLRVYFDNMALYFECRININAILQTVFLAILPTGQYHCIVNDVVLQSYLKASKNVTILLCHLKPY